MIGLPPSDGETPTMVGGVSRASVESYLQATRLAQDRIAEVTSAVAALKAENEAFRVKVEASVARRFEEGREHLLLSSVQTLENLDDAIRSAREGGAAEGLIEGVLLVRSQLSRLLQDEGLQRISVLGLPFDPATSEIVRTLPVDEEGQDGLVIEEMRSGQQLRGRVVRKARVAVGEYMTIVDEEEIPQATTAMPVLAEPPVGRGPEENQESREDEEEVVEPTQAMPVLGEASPPEVEEPEEPEDHTIVRPPPFDEREVADASDAEDEPVAAEASDDVPAEDEGERTDATTVMAAVSAGEGSEPAEAEEDSTVVRAYPMAESESAEEADEPADSTVVQAYPMAQAEGEAEEEPAEPASRVEAGGPLPPEARAAYVPPVAPPPPQPVAAPSPRLPERPRAPEPPPPASAGRAPRPAPAQEFEESRPAGKGRGLVIIAGIVLLGVAAFAATLLVSRGRTRQAATGQTATVAPAPGAAPGGESVPGAAPVEESITVVVPTIPTDVVIVPPAPATAAPAPPIPTIPMRTVPTPPPTTAPNPAPALVAQADRAIAAARYDDALRLYEQAAQADPRNSEATAGRARATTLRDLARRTFAGSPTSVQTESTGKGPAGFDTSDVKVTKPAKNSGRIDFEVMPKMPLPGQPYTVAIYLMNTGTKDFKVEAVRAGVTVNGQGAPRPQTAKVKEVAPGQRTLVAEVSDQWKDATMSWSFSATVTAPGAERFTSKLTWK